MNFQIDPNCISNSSSNNNVNNNGDNNKSDNCVATDCSSSLSALPFIPSLGSELFYSHSPAGFDFPGGIEAWRSSSFRTRPQMYCDYAMFRGIDFNGSRRKNATRETTSTLKAWLNEHRKNPYPTKAEKIMLAIMTQMTLTQVSTWFANARRRLKKENKMTWSPRNRCDEDEIIETPFSSNHRSTTSSSPSSALSSSSPPSSANNSTLNQPHPIIPNPIQKPKIWSIVDTATSDSV